MALKIKKLNFVYDECSCAKHLFKDTSYIIGVTVIL
jgi:hypothetical protein